MGELGSSETETDPWYGLQPYLTTGFARLQEDLLETPQFVGFAPETELALAQRTDRAIEGNPLLNLAQQQTADTISGNYLGPSNPYLEQLQDSVMSTVMPGVDSRFNMASGRFGSPLHAEALGRGASRAMAPYLFNEYGNERNRMMQATQLAPSLAREDYFDMAQLGMVGDMRRQLEIERITEPARRAQAFLAALSGTAPLLAGTGTSETSENISPLGMGLVGAGMATQLGGTLGGAALLGCWVARAVYGEDNPEWLNFRTRMFSRAPKWFVAFYMKHGPAIAKLVKRWPWLKKTLRPLMDRAWR